MKYIGKRTDKGLHVYRGDGKKLPLRLDLRKHSPTGFGCGYNGSGPAQLALAMLADYFGDDLRAQFWYQFFKERVIARLPQDRDWELTWDEIARAVAEVEAEHPQLFKRYQDEKEAQG